jgi:hypothetical protein
MGAQQAEQRSVVSDAELLERIRRYEALKREVSAMFDRFEAELEEQTKRYEGEAMATDLAGNIAKSLTSLVRLGFMSTRETGKALEKINREAAHDALDMAFAPIVDQAVEAAARSLGASSEQIRIYGSAILQAYLDYSSVTFWTRVIANKRDGKSIGESIALAERPGLEYKLQIQESKERALAQINDKILETRLLMRHRHPGSRPSPGARPVTQRLH